jgi:fido (protein-threonine AMPylation protein)
VTRACDRYDLTLAEHHPDRSVEEYEEMMRHLEVQYVAARAVFLKRAFVNLPIHAVAQAVHKGVFNGIYPFAGRFRQPGEPIFVGHNRHEFTGSPPERIEEHLHELEAVSHGLGEAPRDRERFADWAAMFLQKWLVIHPFIDGNGRVGRFLVEVAAAETGVLHVDVRMYGTKDRRNYLDALQYAHKPLGITLAGDLPGQTPGRALTGLARWWLERIEYRTDESEEPPPWLTG